MQEREKKSKRFEKMDEDRKGRRHSRDIQQLYKSGD